MKTVFGDSLGRVWILFLALLSIYIFRFRNKIKIRGRKNLPKGKNILFVSNHQTLIDSMLIGIGTASLLDIFFRYDKVPWNAPDYNNFFSHPVGKQLIYISKCIPAHRKTSNMEIINQDIASFIEVLKDGRLVIFFEGTRTRTGEIGDCKYGVARTIQSAKPIVVPILLKGVQAIMPIESGFNFSKIYGGNKGEMIIGKPIVFSDLNDLETIKREVKAAVKTLG